MDPYLVTFLPSHITLKAEREETILEISRRAGVDIEGPCGGRGRCGKCKVLVKKSKGISEPSEEERQILKALISSGYRLACQAVLRDETTISIPKAEKCSEVRTNKGIKGGFPKLRPVSFVEWELEESDIKACPSKEEIILRGLKRKGFKREAKVELELLKGLPPLHELLEKRLIFVLLKDGEILKIAKDPIQKIYGIAFDIGTTTIGGYLVDLMEGQVAGSLARPNAQRAFGHDVMSRVSFSMEHPKGLTLLRSSLLECMNKMVEELCDQIDIRPDMICEGVLVGNTVMHHIFLGFPLKDLAHAPYRPLTTKAIRLRAKETGLFLSETGHVNLLPPKAAFLGSDIVAAVLATGIHKRKEPSLLMDIGTNAEIVLGNRERLLCTSAAASPAFEGAHLKCGTWSMPGAIERVEVEGGGQEIRLKTIGGLTPKGICGSGVISALASFLKAGLISKTGRLSHKIPSSRLREGEEGLEILLYKGEGGEEVVITEKEIGEIMLAKGAIKAGIQVLRRHWKGEEISQVTVTGSFGASLGPSDLKEIGLIPLGVADTIKTVENAAGIGACMALLGVRKRKEIERIVSMMEYVELSQDPEFEELLVEGLLLEGA